MLETVPRAKTTPPRTTLPGFYTTAEISARTGMRQENIGRLIRQGKIKALRVGSIWLIKQEDWEAYEEHKRPWGMPRGRRTKRRKTS